ncbi:hypothetical protein [Rhizobium sp. 007]|uniref:hypothetical protein n=1 Tax=Rhizobium sp. 007 TaxID=2785056 RepID=UPI00188ED215|nr:hypothetical protein [Rhizobium sp. 007]QPB24779.1 hypothetical protein ISN39_35645 [Rhizobium sp. 007]
MPLFSNPDLRRDHEPPHHHIAEQRAQRRNRDYRFRRSDADLLSDPISRPETDELEIWLGTGLEEFPSLQSLIEAARAQGYEITRLDRAAIMALVKESGQESRPFGNGSGLSAKALLDRV